MLRDRANRRQTQAFAPGTRVNHISHLRIFLLFTVFFDLQAFPADVHTLLLFIEFLTLSFTSPKSVSNVMASVKLHHERLGVSLQHFGHLKLRLAFRSLGRTMRTHTVQAAPFPPRLLAPLARFAGGLGG